MDIKTYANQSRLPLNALLWMVKKNVINDPLTDSDYLGLKILEQIWGSSELLRSQIKKFSKADRKRLIETCEFETKWEAYAHTRFNDTAFGERLTMKQLVSEIELNYEFSLDFFQKQKLYKIREKVYNQRRYQKKKGSLNITQ